MEEKILKKYLVCLDSKRISRIVGIRYASEKFLTELAATRKNRKEIHPHIQDCANELWNRLPEGD